MAVSSVKAFYKRKYKTSASGNWKYDEERQAAQIYSTRTYPDGYYQAYMENNPKGLGLTGLWSSKLGNYGCYCYYEPGQIFFPEEYYTIDDFFPENQILEIISVVSDFFENNDDDVKFIWKSPNGSIFWQNDDGLNFIPLITIRIDKAGTGLTKKRQTWIAFTYMLSILEPNQIHSRNDGTMFKLDEYGNEVDLVYGTDYTGFTFGSSGICYCYMAAGNTSLTKTETLTQLNYFITKLNKLKFYPFFTNNSTPLFDTTYDNVAYFASNVDVSSTSATNTLMFLIDISNCPGFPTRGFYPADTGLATGFLSKIDFSDGGPEPTDPGETDDPYGGDDDDDDDDDEGGGGDFDDTDDPVPTPTIPPISATGVGLVTVYNPSAGQLQSLANKLWSPDFWEAVSQYFTSPLESIIGLSIVPVQPTIAQSQNIFLGMYDTQVVAPVVASDYIIVNCGSIPINRYWGSYLDYDPYTKISCYLPYIGEIALNPDQLMQKNLGIIYYVNIITGDTVAVLTANGSVFATAAGNCVRQLPIAQKDYSSIINTAVAAVGVTAMAIATAGAGSAAMSGAGAGVSNAAVKEAAVNSATAKAASANVASGASLLNTVADGKGQYVHVGQIGTGSGQLAMQKPFLTIERPNLDLASSYKSYVGYPCNKTLTLGQCKGFTQIEATKLSIPGATDEEISEILSILVEGVII